MAVRDDNAQGCLHNPLQPMRNLVPCDNRSVDGADRSADYPIRLHAGFMQCLVNAPLIGALGAATLHDKHDLAGKCRARCRLGLRSRKCTVT